MKKTFAILLASLAAVVLSACSAADDSTITSPRMGKIANDICPNPTCHHFLGNTPYTELAEHKECPYCHCRFTE